MLWQEFFVNEIAVTEFMSFANTFSAATTVNISLGSWTMDSEMRQFRFSERLRFWRLESCSIESGISPIQLSESKLKQLQPVLIPIAIVPKIYPSVLPIFGLRVVWHGYPSDILWQCDRAIDRVLWGFEADI